MKKRSEGNKGASTCLCRRRWTLKSQWKAQLHFKLTSQLTNELFHNKLRKHLPRLSIEGFSVSLEMLFPTQKELLLELFAFLSVNSALRCESGDEGTQVASVERLHNQMKTFLGVARNNFCAHSIGFLVKMLLRWLLILGLVPSDKISSLFHDSYHFSHKNSLSNIFRLLCHTHSRPPRPPRQRRVDDAMCHSAVHAISPSSCVT